MNIKFNKLLANLLTLTLFIAFSFAAYSQPDGEKIFKANCASCHHPIKNATGPKLQGALQKWSDAGEEDLIYEWVKNPSGLYNSGKSKLAKAIWDWSPTAMTPQGHLSKEDVKAVFAYVDSYAPPAAASDADMAGNNEKVDEGSDTYWWWIISAILIFILFAISGVRRELSAAIAVKEGKEVDSKRTFVVSAKEWVVRNWFATVLLIITVCDLSTSKIGIPKIGDDESCLAAGFTTSFAPRTRATSQSSNSLFTSSRSLSCSYEIFASAKSTFMCPGILPATGCMAYKTFFPFFDKKSATSLTAC